MCEHCYEAGEETVGDDVEDALRNPKQSKSVFVPGDTQ